MFGIAAVPPFRLTEANIPVFFAPPRITAQLAKDVVIPSTVTRVTSLKQFRNALANYLQY